jgi:SH3-like domain-containing protein
MAFVPTHQAIVDCISTKEKYLPCKKGEYVMVVKEVDTWSLCINNQGVKGYIATNNLVAINVQSVASRSGLKKNIRVFSFNLFRAR